MAAALPTHDGEGGLAEPQRSEQVDVQDRSGVGFGDLLDRADEPVARVVHEYVDAACDGGGRCDGAHARDPVRRVERHDGEVGVLDGQGRLAGGGHDMVARRQHVAGEGKPEAAARARDEPGLESRHAHIQL